MQWVVRQIVGRVHASVLMEQLLMVISGRLLGCFCWDCVSVFCRHCPRARAPGNLLPPHPTVPCQQLHSLTSTSFSVPRKILPDQKKASGHLFLNVGFMVFSLWEFIEMMLTKCCYRLFSSQTESFLKLNFICILHLFLRNLPSTSVGWVKDRFNNASVIFCMWWAGLFFMPHNMNHSNFLSHFFYKAKVKRGGPSFKARTRAAFLSLCPCLFISSV